MRKDMKRYFIYIMMVVATLFVGCTTDITEFPEMVEVGDIEVLFQVDGAETRTLDLQSFSQEVVVEVYLNNEGVYWTPISDKEWCQIVEEEHCGSGSFTIKVDANNSFDARETATITFVAGEYSVRKLSVNHLGNVFLLDQNYAVSLQGASSVKTKVRTIEGVEWDFDNSDIMRGEKGNSTTANGVTTTEVTISWDENNGISSLNELHLVTPTEGDTDGLFYVWQYGTDLNYDAEGNLLLAAKDVAPIEVRAPMGIIKGVEAPSWVSVEEVKNSDRTTSFMLSFADNPSDARTLRLSEISLSMLAGTSNVALPPINQEYYPVDGILTGEGLRLFAETWNAGEDVSQWYVDGVPTIVGDVNMVDVKEWVSIGTKTRPFTGKFNGNGKKLCGLKANQPIFGICEGAEISNLTIDAESEFLEFNSFEQEYYLAALAADIRATTISSCVNNASVKFEGSSDADECYVYVAGLVGKADATSIVQLSTNNGPVTVTNSCSTPSEAGSVYVAGLVAYNAGGIYDGFNNADIFNAAISYKNWTGGITGINAPSGQLERNLSAMKVSYESPKGTGTGCKYGYVGGIVGEATGTLLSNVNESRIISNSATSTVYVGGIAGYASGDDFVSQGNSNRTNTSLEVTNTPAEIYLGGHYGYLDMSAYTDEGGEGIEYGGKIVCGEAASKATLYMGGVIGSSTGAVTLRNITRNGDITFDFARATNYTYFYAGGIVGYVDSALVIENSTTEGDVYMKMIDGTSFTLVGKYSIGGVVGASENGLNLKTVTNKSTFTWENTSARSNSYPVHVGGVVGRILGNATITDCHNTGIIRSWHYNNNVYPSSGWTCNATGGIVGSCGFDGGDEGKVVITKCSSTNNVAAYRGVLGGIAGYMKGGEIKECSFTGSMPYITQQRNPYAGGIVGAAVETLIKDCKATGSYKNESAGSCVAHGGGIAAHILEGTVIDGCSFFGNIESIVNDSKDEYSGGVVGYADDSCVIKNTKFGGSVLGITISENNYTKYVQGVNANSGEASEGIVENCSYWNGE